jgi:hypothetical protein
MERAESEKWDLYTENRKITGEHAIRGEKSQIPDCCAQGHLVGARARGSAGAGRRTVGLRVPGW